MMKLRFSWQLIACTFLIMAFCSCDNDDNPKPNPAPPDDSDKELLIGVMVANPDGMSGAAYMQLVEGLKEAEYDNSESFETSYAVPTIVRENDCYILPGVSNTAKDEMVRYTVEDNQLIFDKKAQLPAQSQANALEIVKDKIYVSYHGLGKIGVFKESDLTLIKEIDITSYGVGDSNPDPCQIVERDGILYVALNQILGVNHVPDPNRAKVDVLLIDTNTDEPIKMITEETSGMSMPTRFEADDYGMFVDENDDIYINCIAGFGFIGHTAGFLRIKKGETDFDNSYQFKISETAIEGEPNKADYIPSLRYVGNGIAYAVVDIPAYYSQPDYNYLSDKTMFPVEINLTNKTIKYIGNKPSTNYGIAVSLYEDKVIFGLATDDANGFYIYNPKTDKMSEDAVIKVSGYPYFAHYIDD